MNGSPKTRALEFAFDDDGLRRFLSWERHKGDGIYVPRAYIDIAGRNHAAALLLAQIIFWFVPNSDGSRKKYLVEREGLVWLALPRSAWEREARMTEDEFDYNLRALEAADLVEHESHYVERGAAKQKMVHVRVQWVTFLDRLEDVLDATKSGDSGFGRPTKSGDSGFGRDTPIYNKNSTTTKNEEGDVADATRPAPGGAAAAVSASHPAIVLLRDVMCKTPRKALWADIAETVGAEPSPDDIAFLKQCWREATRRGYTHRYDIWLFEWFFERRIPKRRPAGGRSAEETMDRNEEDIRRLIASKRAPSAAGKEAGGGEQQ